MNAPFVSNFSYTTSGGISQMRLGNGRWETAKFNNRMQITELGLGASASDAGTWKTQYEYGELQSNGTFDTAKNTGNIAKRTLSFNGITHPLVQSYKYDTLYRITEATETSNSVANWFQTWGYDLYGNRISFTQNIGGNPASSNPTIDTNTNRFSINQGFAYDKNGNVTSNVDPITSQARTFLFNADNKQYEVKNAFGATIARYYYDGEGKRVKKKVYDPNNPSVVSEETIFVYSSGKLVAEYSTSTPPATPTVNYTTTDHLGSPRVITDAIGQVTSRRDFLPFGEEVTINVGARSTALKYGSSDDKVRQKFTGYQKDTETSLDFAEARMYDNRFGRFTAIDPLLASGKSANPQTFNRYIYVGNSPIVLRDPTGLIGDYYTRSGHYIGSDKKDDGKYYYAEIDYLETRAEGPDLIHVKNTEEFFLESRTSTSQNSGEREAIRAFGGGFEGSIGDIQSGSWTGLWNIPSTAWNAAVTSTLLPFALPNASIRTDGFGLPSLYVPIPFLAKGYEYDNARRARWGQQITAAAFIAPGAVAAPFSVGSSLSVVPARAASTNFKPGSFSIIDWTGYPEGGVKPTGPFRLVEGQEYIAARNLANKSNASIHGSNPQFKGMQIHEIKPVKFDGSPTSRANKMALSRIEHAQYTRFWNNLMRDLKK